MHDPKMSTMTAHAQQDPRSHAPLVGSGLMSEDRVAFGCSSSGSAYRHQPLLQSVPIPLHHYLPFQHHHRHHNIFFPGGKMGMASGSDRVPPLSPPIADTVPSTLPLALPVSSYALTSSALEAARDLPLHRVYDNSQIASSALLHHHNIRLPAHLRAMEHERIFPFMPSIDNVRPSELARWGPMFDLDLAAAAHYYRSLGTSDHRLDLAQKTSPGFGLLSPVLAGANLVGSEYLTRQGRVHITDLPLAEINSLSVSQSVTSPPGNSQLPASKTSYASLSSPSLALSIPSTLPPSLSSSSSSPTSSLSKRAGALTLSSPSCTSTKPASHPSSYSTSLPAPSPAGSPRPLSATSQGRRQARLSKSPGPPRETKYEQHHIHKHTHELEVHNERSHHSYYQGHQRRFSEIPPSDPHSVQTSANRLNRKHLWNQVDLEPMCHSPKRPALLSSLSMPGQASSLSSPPPPPPPIPPGIETSHRASPISNGEGYTPRFNGLRDSPSPADRKPSMPLEDSKFEPFYTYPNISHPPSPVNSSRHGLHEHLLLSTHVKTERLEPWPFNGSIVSGIPPARYSSRATLYRYDSYSTNPSSDPSTNGRVSPPVQGRDTRDSRASPGKELPTRILKQERARDRQDVTSALDADREHAERFNNIKKCASTQTQFSSFMGESSAPPPPPPPPPYYTTHDTVPHDSILNGQHHTLHNRSSYPHPPPPLHSYYSHSLAHPGASVSISSAAEHPPPSHPSSTPRGISASSHATAATSPLSSSYLPPPPPPSHQPAPSYSNPHHSRHPHASPSPPAGTTPTLPPAPPLVHAPLRSTPPLPPYPGPPLPPPHYHADLSRNGADVQHAPLNLSLSHTATPSQFQPISSGRRSPTNKRVAKGVSSHQQRPSSLENGFGSPMSQEDESIEEHFRRSLGKSYPEPAAPAPVAVPAPAPVSPPVTLTVQKPGNPQPDPTSPSKVAFQATGEKICSVDDHFARALGDQMWTEIKARSEIASLDGLTDTVDAHFAKALGANMWKKLKEENKGGEEVTTHKQKQQQTKSSLSLVVHNSSKTSTTSHSPVQAPLVT